MAGGRTWECPECGARIVGGPVYPRCKNHRMAEKPGMYQVLSEGRLSTTIKPKTDPLKSGE